MTDQPETRIGFMCGTDFQDELGQASGGTRLYPSAADLKEHGECWWSCGLVEVEVRLVRWIEPQDLAAGGRVGPQEKPPLEALGWHRRSAPGLPSIHEVGIRGGLGVRENGYGDLQLHRPVGCVAELRPYEARELHMRLGQWLAVREGR